MDLVPVADTTGTTLVTSTVLAYESLLLDTRVDQSYLRLINK